MSPNSLRVLSGLMALAFVGSAAVQLNDPDPYVWVAVYVVAAMFSALGAFKWPLSRAVGIRAGVFGGLCAVWGLLQIPRVLETSPPWDQVFSSMQMMAPGVEEAREGLGLLLIGAWMGWLALTALRRADRQR